jgi:hypothetical protein
LIVAFDQSIDRIGSELDGVALMSDNIHFHSNLLVSSWLGK